MTTIGVIFLVVLFLVCLTIGWIIAVFGIKRKPIDSNKKTKDKEKDINEQ